MDDTDATVEKILRSYDTITVVGASNAPRSPPTTCPRTCSSTAGGSCR